MHELEAHCDLYENYMPISQKKLMHNNIFLKKGPATDQAVQFTKESCYHILKHALELLQSLWEPLRTYENH